MTGKVEVSKQDWFWREDETLAVVWLDLNERVDGWRCGTRRGVRSQDYRERVKCQGPKWGRWKVSMRKSAQREKLRAGPELRAP